MLKTVATLFLWVHILCTAIIFGGSIYETMVINSVWYSNLPQSLSFMTNPEYSVKPGKFWQAFGPIPGMVMIITFALNMFVRGRRALITISLVCILFNTLTTIFYFVPILMVIFSPDGGGRSGEELTQLALNWKNGTWVRMAALLISLVVSIVALSKPLPLRDARPLST